MAESPELSAMQAEPTWVRRLLRQCLRHRKVMAFVIAATVVGTTIEVAVPLIAKNAIDAAVGGSTDIVITLAVALVLLAIIRFGSQFTRRMLAGRLALEVQHDLRLALLHTVQRFDGKRQDELRSGQLVSRSISDLQQVHGLLAMAPLSGGAVLQFILALGVMTYLSLPLTLAAMLFIPAMWLLVRTFRMRIYAATWSAQQRAADVTQQVEETVTGVRIVKGFGQEQRMVDLLSNLSRALYGERLRAARINSKFAPTMAALPQLGLVVIISFGSYLALRGDITVGTLVAFAAYLAALSGSARLLGGFIVTAQLSRAAVERVFDVVNTHPHVLEPDHPLAVPDGPLGIEFSDVTFGFNPERPVLHSVSLAVNPGETLAIIGAPGSGKSALAALVPRFYLPQKGTITLTGATHGAVHTQADRSRVDLAEVHSTELRRRIAVVFDEPFLFSDTIAANIAVGAPDATPDEIIEAARIADIHDFIVTLPQGYDSEVGERGLTLSGGQRQRIALARALLTRPDILILDDAVSAVDALTEHTILRNLARSSAHLTIVSIVHRISSLRLADKIAVLEKGQLVDLGSESELTQRSSAFRNLMKSDRDNSLAPHHQHENAPSGPTSDHDLWPAIPSVDSPADQRPELAQVLAELPVPRDEPPPDEGPLGDVRADERPFTLRSTLRPVRWLIVASAALLAIEAATVMALPSIARFAIDHGVLTGNISTIVFVAFIGFALVAVGWCAAHLTVLFTSSAGERVLYQLRVRTYTHLQRLGLDYYERELSGRIITRMTTDIDALSAFLQTSLATAVVSLLTLFGVSVALLATDVSLAGLTLVAVPILIVATLVFRSISSAAYTVSRERIAKVNAEFHENIAGIRTSQAYRREAVAAERFTQYARGYVHSRMRAQRAIAVYFPGIALLSDFALVAVLFVGTSRIADGSLTPGALVAFVLYLGLLFGPVQQLSQVFDSYQQALVGLRRIGDLLRTAPSVSSNADTRPVGDATRKALSLDNVTFAYRADSDPVLSAINVTIEPGTTVALVGPTGAGKSTIVKLLARFYEPSSGTVRADGIDIRAFDISDFRSRIGIVPQEPHLFSGDVASNISFARPDATRADIEKAASDVGALQMIKHLPGGMKEPIGERGRGLSSGERQLIALARAALAAPDLMLLDEATASLDPASERLVLSASERLMSTRTSVLVAHRLETAARADRILVVHGGEIIESGHHHNLLRQGGYYADLWNSAQSSAKTSPADENAIEESVTSA
ncbi:ABC transporter ATP-binding protein [Hoyosella rhizosphaerae]|uniref:ABC transporter n=2 Tax=Hoyosella rhizosphaerae TaxID=1755582 RepID=A0A916XG09_9ACTN|nr:ABC transporter ATP-binding protein [Hoyosella rhizosphaerae]GGC70626.1 ABC transporter [Hoyosella rhizosphaerae]